ncbi:TatD family hydrolase [Thalassotalea profundi]|uniref:DNAse n=1 Tax=Thalassotalea profundi TaxID=2036687 RepID=A0ABQ3IL51_9GAMM|nr:TatD family hydrolase [Thalassotalea profundi]GHE87621.1 DNAse [Thalassotalea profundi]
MSSLTFTDSHCHLDFSELSTQTPELLTQCYHAGIQRIIVPAVSPKNWQKTLNLVQNKTTDTPSVLAALGIHPWYLQGLTYQDLDILTSTIIKSRAKIIAIGETGIDGKIAKQQANLAKQITFFNEHIRIANQFKLPLIVHHRSSHPIIYQQLKQNPVDFGGVIHAFSGSYQQACQYIDLGFKLGIGGTISYERAQKTINTLKKLPLSSIILETDAPAMPLSGFQGMANSPLKIIDVFNLLCRYRNEEPETIAFAIEENIKDLFIR